MFKHLTLLLLIAGTPSFVPAQSNEVRVALEKAYKQNADAYMRSDIAAVMALRAPDFHTLTPDRVTRDRREMELYMTGIMNGVRK